jgi:hypothetical protein
MVQCPRQASGLLCTHLAGSSYAWSLSLHTLISLIDRTHRWLSTTNYSLPWENWVLYRNRVYIFSVHTRLASYTILSQGWPGE